MKMKQFDVKTVTIGEYEFYIKPFPAFKCANLSGELASLLMPVIGSLAPLIGGKDVSNIKVEEMDVETALPAVASAAQQLNGDEVESMMKKLMIDYRNVSVCGEATNGETVTLTEDLANEIFCLEIMDMYKLCIEVVKLNFKGFFSKLGIQSGSLAGIIPTRIPESTTGEPST